MQNLNFLSAVTTALRYEGAPTDDPKDKGGKTVYGFAQEHNPDIDVKELTLESAIQRYFDKFWTPCRFGEYRNARLARRGFDMAVNLGIARYTRNLQTALYFLGEKEIIIDGITGPQTLSLLNKQRPDDVFIFLVALSGEHYLKLARDGYGERFIKGWLRRYFKDLLGLF